MFLIALLTILSLGGLLPGAEWTQYRGNQGDGTSDESLVPLNWPAAGPTLVWRVETPAGFSSFAVAEGRVFTLFAEPSSDGALETCVAFEAQTGRKLWSTPLGSADYGHDGGNSGARGNRGGDGPRSTPSTDGERVYVYDAHLMLRCLDAATGRLLWQHDIVSEFDGRSIKWHNASSPVLDAGRVYIYGGGPGQSFLAFDKISGDLIFKSGDAVLTHSTPILATIANQRQLIALGQAGLVSVDAATGRGLWQQKFPFTTSTAASPVVAGNLVYCSAGYGVGAGLFRVTSGANGWGVEKVWFRANELMNHWSTPVYHEGHIYGIFGFKKYGLRPAAVRRTGVRAGQVVGAGIRPGELHPRRGAAVDSHR